VMELPTIVTITAKPTKRPCQDCGADATGKPNQALNGESSLSPNRTMRLNERVSSDGD
jgi:hypothetical protein